LPRTRFYSAVMLVLSLRLQVFNLSRRLDSLEAARFHTIGELQQIKASVHLMENKIGLPHSPTSGVGALAPELAAAVADHPEFRSIAPAPRPQAEEMESSFSTAPPPTSTSSRSPAGFKKARARKPELSKVVRQTIFRLLGIPSAGNKFHGYASTPVLPDFSPTPLFDPNTGVRLWRWEWSKTIRGSPHNASFANAVHKAIVTERQNEGKYKEVPEADWEDLDAAIDSAYTNLRREKESQTNPIKNQKKLEHRARNKKRGLKDEKSKRRRTAWNALIEDSDNIKLAISKGVPADADVTESFDIRYMSSDESDLDDLPSAAADIQVDPILNSPNFDSASIVDSLHHGGAGDQDVGGSHGDGGPFSVSRNGRRGPRSASPHNGSNEKIFRVRPPIWRAQCVYELYAALDNIKLPERAFKRIQGQPRQVAPPRGTPDWMIDPAWKVKHGE
jgi:hypothetical protein